MNPYPHKHLLGIEELSALDLVTVLDLGERFTEIAGILTGNPAALVCGGPDDSHFNTSGSTVTAHVVPGAAIKVFPVSKMSPEPIQPGKLAAYLATDDDTRIFLVTGPLTAITGLQEQFHP